MDMRGNICGIWRCVIANIMYMRAPGEVKAAIDADMNGYISPGDKVYKNKLLRLDGLLLSKDRTFRSVFYYRFRNHRRICNISRAFLPDIKEIELYGEIGAGLRLYHNHMVVHTKTAGKNLHVGPGVVLGKNNGEYPTIGDNVTIEANSTVIGGISIGDNTVIKAGSVVTKSLEADSVYAGNPARLQDKIYRES